MVGFLLKGLDSAVFRWIPHADEISLVPLGSVFTMSFSFLFSILAISIAERSLAGQPILWSHIAERIRFFFWPAFLINLAAQLLGSLAWVPGFLIYRYDLDGIGFEIGRVLLMLVAMVLTFYVSFVHQALVLRDKRGLAAFVYSVRLVRRGGWRFVAVLLLIMVMTLSLVVLVSAILMGLSPLSWGESMNWGYPVYTFFGTYLTISFTVLFLNMDRVRI